MIRRKDRAAERERKGRKNYVVMIVGKGESKETCLDVDP